MDGERIESAKYVVPVEADISSAEAALDSLEERLDALAEKAKAIVDSINGIEIGGMDQAAGADGGGQNSPPSEASYDDLSRSIDELKQTIEETNDSLASQIADLIDAMMAWGGDS